jgi:glycosyltransferase involved in cell wall biosynthesis/GT2 family glycosyltransferase
MNPQNPKVSIVLPTYNGAKYLRQSVDSCLNQTYKDFELIIVDDCSTDKTAAIMQTYADTRIRYIRNHVNQHLPRALNTGFALARGEYLTWTSDDNFYLPEAIEKMVNILEKTDYEFVYTDIYIFKDDNWQKGEHERLDGPDQLNQFNCVRACFLYTANVMRTTGEYDPDMEFIEDYDYWIRVSQHFEIYHIREPLYYYRFHAQQLYTARSREIKIIELLFKLKYGFMSIDEMDWAIRNLVVSQPGKKFKILWRFILKTYYKPRIRKLLRIYKAGLTSFSQTRTSLYELVNDRRKELRKKHLVLLRRLPLPPKGEWGGMERLMLDWLGRINYENCRVTLAVTPWWKERFQKEVKGLPVMVVEFPFPQQVKSFHKFYDLFKFLTDIGTETAVYFQAYLWEFTFADILAGFLATKNHAFMHENLGAPEPPVKASRRHFGVFPGLGLWWRIPRYWTLSRAYFTKRIIVVSQEIKDRLVSLWGYPADKVAVFYHGINIKKYSSSIEVRQKLREELAILPEEKVVIMTARLTQQKAVDRAIDAFDLMCHEISNLKLMIAGSGPLEGELRALAVSKPSASKIVFLGQVSNAADYLKASDIYLLSSDNEGLSIAFMEALSVGLICVVTRCTGTTEVIQDRINGFLVEKSTSGVLEGLRKVVQLSEEETNIMSYRAREFVCSNFEINENIRKLFILLQVPFKINHSLPV